MSLQDRQTLDRKTPALWSGLIRVLEAKVNEFNAVAGASKKLSLISGFPAFTLARPESKALIVGNLREDRILFSGKNGLRLEVEWRIRVTTDGLDIWLFDSDNRPADMENVSANLIEQLLERTDLE